MDSNDALAALFAAASSKLQTHLSQKQATEKPTKPVTLMNSKKPDQSQEDELPQKLPSATSLIASLMNGSLNAASSLPPTQTTANFTTSTARPSTVVQKILSSSTLKRESTDQPCSSASNKLVIDVTDLRKLESWFDEDAEKLDESQYQELADSGETNGWSADEMFKYNEKRHKIMSNFNHRTINQGYTIPLPKVRSKMSMTMAKKMAAEIEERTLACGGRATPESSDDDELFELERRRRIQMKQQKQLDQLKNLISTGRGNNQSILSKSQKRHSLTGKLEKGNKPDYRSPVIGRQYQQVGGRGAGKQYPNYSDSSVTPPATISSTSSSPKPSDSSSTNANTTDSQIFVAKSSKRNIFRASLS